MRKTDVGVILSCWRVFTRARAEYEATCKRACFLLVIQARDGIFNNSFSDK